MDSTTDDFPATLAIGQLERQDMALKVFFCYAREDAREVQRLEAHLGILSWTIEDVEFWRDRSRITVGEQWSIEIEQAIATSDIFILALTPDWFYSKYIRTKEWPAIEKRTASGRRLLAPVVLKDSQYQEFLKGRRGLHATPSNPKTGRLTPIVGGQWKRESGYNKASEAIVAAIKKKFDLGEDWTANVTVSGNDAELATDTLVLQPKIIPAATPVEISAFSTALESGGQALVQVYLHRPGEIEQARTLAKESDTDATQTSSAVLVVDLSIGERIDIVLEAATVSLDTNAQFLIWQGKPAACQFVLNVPEERNSPHVTIKVSAIVGGAPAGIVRFRLPIISSASPTTPSAAQRGDSARRYKRAFLCYAAADRAEVIKRAQALRALKIDYFLDVISLEVGDRWEQRIREEIDRCDLFLLFWSHHAQASKWVNRDMERALTRHRQGLIDIVPIVLERPMPKPPDDWMHIQFGDWTHIHFGATFFQ